MQAEPSPGLSASLEDYLESVYLCVQKNQVARVKDIAEHLTVSMSSVTGALRNLSSHGLVNYSPYQVVTLTETGRARAVEILRKHEVLRDFLVNVLDLDKESADRNACSMEHAVESEALEKFLEYAEFIENCPRARSGWNRGFRDYCDHGSAFKNCETCLESCLHNVRADRARGGKGEEREFFLDALKPGEKGRVVRLKGSLRIRKRMVEMGLTRNVLVQVERVAPLGDPIQVKVRGYHLTLRKDEAANVKVERF